MSAITNTPSAIDGQVDLTLFDANRQIGLGRDSAGSCVLILPSASTLALEYVGNRGTFSGASSVTRMGTGQQLSPVGVLICDTQDLAAAEVEALASAIVGISVLTDTGDVNVATRAALGLAQLVDQGLLLPSGSELTGFLGELIVLAKSPELPVMVRAWRSDVRDEFDFSKADSRLEVKTTKGQFRQHEISSTQTALLTDRVHLASVKLALVSDGTSVADLVDLLRAKLTGSEDISKFDRVVLDSLRLPPALVREPTIDLQSSLSSIRIWQMADVPMLKMGRGVLWARWGILLDDSQPAFRASTPLVEGLSP